MSAKLEPHDARCVAIFHGEVGAEGAFLQPIGHSQAEGPGEELEILVAVLDGEGDAVGTLLDECPFAVANEAMFREMILIVEMACCAVPGVSYVGEENGCVAAPESSVAVPDDVATGVEEYETLHLGSAEGDAGFEVRVLDGQHERCALKVWDDKGGVCALRNTAALCERFIRVALVDDSRVVRCR